MLSFYQQGEYIDMCVGPHLTYTKALKAFKLTQLSGAYWKNDKNNIMLTRIGGTAFRTRGAGRIQQADGGRPPRPSPHRQEMNLFMLCDEGPGFPFFLPKGMALKNALIDYWRDIHYKAELRRGFHAADYEPPPVGDERPLGSLQGQHVRHQDRRRGLLHQADELPRRRDGLPANRIPIASCRCAWANWVLSIATS